jgi:hypothetical protein
VILYNVKDKGSVIMERNTVRKNMVVLPLAEMRWNQHFPDIMTGWLDK